MSAIYDNGEFPLLPQLQHGLNTADRADFCVGYFNLRGWHTLAAPVDQLPGGEGHNCRLLVGMQRLPSDELQSLLAIRKRNQRMSNQQANHLKKVMAQEFREQLMCGVPKVADEVTLQQLRSQLSDGKLKIKLFLRHLLHAKLYLIYRADPITPRIAYVGSSNLTFAGLSGQGELNVEVTDRDDTQKLTDWFEERWSDRFCLDISQDLARVIDESWAGKLLPPFYIYLKMAYHLSQEARDGLSRYQAPKHFGLLEFQEQAVRVAMQHIDRRNGVIIGDVVGLGKTRVGAAIAHVCETEYGTSTLVICPKTLESMWQSTIEHYGLRGKVVPLSQVVERLPDVPARFRLVLIDESHNLRNREGKRYQAIKDYIDQSGSRCILLTATPYNKGYGDLSAQLRLFLPPEADLGIKPEAYIRTLGGEMQFRRKHSATPVRSLMAFEQSDDPEDWQQLMSRYMLRRTRDFIERTYAQRDERGAYLSFPNGDRFYFPQRQPRTVKFSTQNPQDPYARLYSDRVVDMINGLNLPRYGLGNYVLTPRSSRSHKRRSPNQLNLKTGFEHLDITEPERQILANLSHAGQRLMGFCRTNLFKRLESSGQAFLQSIERHILRNYVYLHAIAHNLPLPIGTQDAALLDSSSDRDEDPEALDAAPSSQTDWQLRAATVYDLYQQQYAQRFQWIRADLFRPELAEDLQGDAATLEEILAIAGTWNAAEDAKLQALLRLLRDQHPQEKMLIFTQFADTARYLVQSLKAEGMTQVGLAIGNATTDPTQLAQRFSPLSNGKTIPPEQQLRILVATDVLSEGQNLQDARIILNYDLPWAIIRLIQRAGRVDRIGQTADEILCYSFLPAEGVEQLINLRGRLRDRLRENQEVVGTDEAFFEDEETRTNLLDLYHEKSGILDEDPTDGDVDLTSEALQIWQTAIAANPKLKTQIQNLPDVVFATRHHTPTPLDPEGVLLYLRTAEGTDALAWVNKDGHSVTQSQMRILRQARCSLDTPAHPRHPQHYELVEQATQLIAQQTQRVSGTMGSRRGARVRTYDRLVAYSQFVQDTTPLLAQGPDWEQLQQAIAQLHDYPLKQNAIARLNRELKAGISDESLAQLVTFLMEHEALCVVTASGEFAGARVICSMGLFNQDETQP